MEEIIAEKKFGEAESLFYGRGIMQDKTRAREIYETCAALNYGRAKYALARCLIGGEGGKLDSKLAVQLMIEGREQQDVLATVYCLLHGYGCQENKEKAFQILDRHVTQERSARVQFLMGVVFDRGYGVAANRKAAAEWYLRAAEQGDAAAQNNLGLMYEHGFGVKKDMSLAVTYYSCAAEQGFAAAQHNLGLCYQHGNGVAKNPEEAAKLMNLAKHDNEGKIAVGSPRSASVRRGHSANPVIPGPGHASPRANKIIVKPACEVVDSSSPIVRDRGQSGHSPAPFSLSEIGLVLATPGQSAESLALPGSVPSPKSPSNVHPPVFTTVSGSTVHPIPAISNPHPKATRSRSGTASSLGPTAGVGRHGLAAPSVKPSRMRADTIQ